MAKRYLMWILFSFVFTLFICTFLSSFPVLIGAIFILLVGIIAALIPFSLRQTICSCAVSSLLAILLFIGMQHWVEKRTLQLMDEPHEVYGEIIEIGNNSAANLTRYRLRLKEIEGEGLAFYERFDIYLYADARKGKEGDYIHGEIEFFNSPIEYGYGREDRIFISGYQAMENLSFERSSSRSLTAILSDFNQRMQERICYGSEKTIGLLKSVCIGVRDSLDASLRVSLGRIGLSHVMAVSGLHLSFTVMLFNSLMMALGIHYRVRYLIDIFISILFTAMVGFPPSCSRACVMLVLYSLAMVLGIFSDSLTSLSVACFVLCLYNPLIVRDVGFLLSVLATAGIITMKIPIEHFLFPLKLKAPPWVNGLYRTFTGIFACSLAATLFTFPILIITFGSISVIGPLANLVLILPLQIFFMMGILMLLLGWIPLIGISLGWLCDLLYIPIEWIANAMGKLRYAELTVFEPASLIVVLVLLAILGIALYHYLKHQRRSFLPLVMIFLLSCELFGGIYMIAQKEDDLRIAFVDVGQGDCTVISKGDKAVIFDYGGSSEKRYNLIEYLEDHHIHTVELLAFTHMHSDHTNGLNTLLKNVYVDQILYPYFENDQPHLYAMLQEQNSDLLKDAHPIKVLEDVVIEPLLDASFKGQAIQDNERCVCYRINIDGVSVLVTGDLQGKAELTLPKEALDCTILKVPHHGSRSSSLYPFLKAASPEIAVVSVGENSYNLPDPEVISRLKSICMSVYTTMDEGTIEFETDGITLERIS